MSTATAPALPYARIVTILVAAFLAAYWLEGELLKVSVFVLAVCAGLTINEMERMFRYYKQRPRGIEYLRSITYRHLDFFAGTEQDYRSFFAGECNKPERIAHVATRLRTSGRIYSVTAPGRHHNIEALLRQVGIPLSSDTQQGFVSTRGRWLNRKEACVVATLANQLIRKTPPETELFSEDIWDPAVYSHQQLKDKAEELIAHAQGSLAMVRIDWLPAFPNLKNDDTLRMKSHVQDARTRRARPEKVRAPAL